MKNLKFVFVVVLALFMVNFASLSWGYSFSVSGDYAQFFNDSGSDATLNLTLYYGEGSSSAHYEYSTDGNSWNTIEIKLDGQEISSPTIGANGSFYLKFVMGNGSDAPITGWSNGSIPVYFEYNNGDFSQDPIWGCVAVMEASSVPVPAAAWLLGSGLVGLLGLGRRPGKS